ncbi:hypothetical protein ACQKWADRAFT_326509 [Trichoderma austrokoningii]
MEKGNLIPRKTFPQVPWQTLKNPKTIQDHHAHRWRFHALPSTPMGKPPQRDPHAAEYVLGQTSLPETSETHSTSSSSSSSTDDEKPLPPGRLEDAIKSLKRLASPEVNVQATLAFIVETDWLEQELGAGSTYLDISKGDNWRRTEMSMGVYSVGSVGSLVSWLLFGRRMLFVSGLAWFVILQFVIGILDCIPGRPSGAI